ncbi:unnamed protein product [Haemonchus placei]|uniref:WH1 domain-containing protein n=1 Tax=Haemonchus placei TaxID=6290 RepID=A0A0N4W7D5_HAEPC|nr:unnamed protein product [Haemonchus placei]
MLFSILGPDNVSLSAAVVELLFVENRQWKLTFRGVISLVKLLGLPEPGIFSTPVRHFEHSEIVGLQTVSFLYRGFQAGLYANCPCLLTFEDESHRQVYGLNFASVEEAQDFKGHLDKRREQEGKSGNLSPFCYYSDF